MNAHYLLAVLLASAIVLSIDASHRHLDEPSPSNQRLLEELEMEMELEDVDRAMSRPRRVPVSGRKCGVHILKFVHSVCDGPCTISSNVNIASKCCASNCGVEEIREMCCP